MRFAFANQPRISAGLSERSDGSMVWRNSLPVDETVKKNRDEYFKRQGIDPGRVAAGGTAHGVKVAVVGEPDAGKYLLNTDALVTDVPNLFLMVTVADCLPVYFYDPVKRAVGMAHAGWRGLTAGILENVVRQMEKSYGSNSRDLLVAIGPHICARHYEVGQGVAAKFAKQNINKRAGRLFAGLAGEAGLRLNRLGVKQITISAECTYEDKRFYSARRDKLEPLQGMAAHIGIK